ncbi:MAG: hypothetical protein ACYC1E_09775 [Propionibacteriaceae bacterium]
MTLDDTRTRRYEFAGASALTVLTWYALPDVVRSRRARMLVKAGLLVVTAVGAAMIPQVYPDVAHHAPAPYGKEAEPLRARRALAATAAALLGTIWFEKAVFARGERRRTNGVRCPHTRAAAAMALVTGAAAAIDWTGASKAES